MFANLLDALNAIGRGSGFGSDDLANRLVYKSGTGSPVGVVTPDFIGQFYFDSLNLFWYQATALTSNGWDNSSPTSLPVDVVIPINDSDSAALDCRGMTLLGFRMPASFDGANIRFLESATLGGTYNLVYQTNGNVLESTVGINRTILFGDNGLQALDFIKFRSSSTETAARTIQAILRAV